MPAPWKTRLAVGSLALILAAAFERAHATPFEYLGQAILPTGSGYAGTTVGGLSGIDALGGGRFVAISDDRSSLNPARFYTLEVDLAMFQRSTSPGAAGVAFTAVTTIQRPDGSAFPTHQVDPESIRYDRAAGTLLWSNEGQRSAAGFQDPTVREMRLDGSHVRDFAVPGRYSPAGSVAGTTPGDRGVVNNLAFESLALARDGRTLYAATENALAQDGPPASVAAGSASRIVSFDVATGAAGKEWVYRTEPVAIPPNPATAFATNGLVELLALGRERFLAVERSFAVGAVTPGTPVTGNTIRLYLVDAAKATDVSGLDSIAGQPVTAVKKTLLADLAAFTQADGTPLALDNIEGVAWGPRWNGQRTLLLVSDNNFSPTQFTQFVALSLTSPIPEPGTLVLLAGGLAGVCWRVRRRAA
jgi:hypothetical protein